MSVKHVVRYYKQVANSYSEMNRMLKEMEKEYNENLVSSEQFEQMKKTIEPLKDNYMTLSWIMFLLKQPNKEEHRKTYERKNKVFLSSLDKNKDKDHIIEQNNSVLKNLKSK